MNNRRRDRTMKSRFDEPHSTMDNNYNSSRWAPPTQINNVVEPIYPPLNPPKTQEVCKHYLYL